jgi:hypothetical protein
MDTTTGFSLDLEITQKVKEDSILLILLKKLLSLVKACLSPFTPLKSQTTTTLHGLRAAIR